jgi:signal transduction histidine kinase/CheY-like chemotaxis protein
MKLVRKKKEDIKEENPQPPDMRTEQPALSYPNFSDTGRSAWKVLVVDDEPDVHAITRLSLKNFNFADRGVEFLDAMSGKEAESILKNTPDIAVAMIDVVMETEDAGLRLVKFIREELRNKVIRLIIRTGQPGAAPERYVIDHYDIDDYKDKTELIAQKLYTTMRSAVKAYRDISTIARNRQGLEKILYAAPELYRIQPIRDFFEGVLTQMIGCCNLGKDNLISTINGFLAISEGGSKVVIQAGTGRFADPVRKDEVDKIVGAFFSGETILPENSLLVPLKIQEEVRGFIYMEDARLTRKEDLHLIHIMANQCASALENLNLYHNLEAANKLNEKKNQFLGMAAHDLRNPLSGIKMVSDMLLMSAKERLQPDELELLTMAESLINTAVKLVSDLLDIAKIEAGKLELDIMPTDISGVIRESLEMNHFLAESKQIALIFEADETFPDIMPEIMIDPGKIQQVMSNLISNALKYSYPRTTVKVRLSKPDENKVMISVTDEGQGIPEDEITKMFQPFSRTSVKSTGGEESTGLGLVICKKIVEAHGGVIRVETKVGMGSTFYVSIPFLSEK